MGKAVFFTVAVSFLIIIVSCHKEEQPVPAPVIEILSDKDIELSCGDTTVTVRYRIENPAEGGDVSGYSAADWIGDYSDCPSDGAFTFKASANSGDGRRSATLVLTYGYAGGSVKDSIGVVQAGKPADDPAPDPDPDQDQDPPYILILTGLKMNIPAAETAVTIQYMMQNPASDGYMLPTSDAGWIRELEDHPDNSTVTFTVEANSDVDGRSTEIMMSYYYGENGESMVERPVIIEQVGYVPESVEFEAVYFSGHYLGDQFGHNGEIDYMINLSDQPIRNGLLMPGGTYYTFDIYSTQPEDMDAISVPAGTYTLGRPFETELMTCDPEYTYWCRITPDGTDYEVPFTRYQSVSLTIEKEGDGYYYHAELVDNKGTVHKLTYRGDAVIDNTVRYSTLLEDRHVDGNALVGTAIYYGEEYGTSAVRWTLKLTTPGGGDAFQIDLVTDASSSYGDGLPSGTFRPSSDGANALPGEFVIGNMGTTFQGTWFYTTDEFGNFNDPYAPLVDGEITVTAGPDGEYTVVLECQDDASTTNTVTTTWRGVPEYMDAAFSAPLFDRSLLKISKPGIVPSLPR